MLEFNSVGDVFGFIALMGFGIYGIVLLYRKAKKIIGFKK